MDESGWTRPQLTLKLLASAPGGEWAMESHMIGDAFALIEPEVLRTVALPSWAAGASINASLRNVSGTASNSSPIVLSGESVRPLSPVALDARIDSTGALMLAWTRRTRKGFAWIDGVDAPLGESFEQYRVKFTGPSGSIEVITSAPTAQIPASQMASVGSGQVTIEVRQIGDMAASRPGQSTLTV
jgi:hypothetical protein